MAIVRGNVPTVAEGNTASTSLAVNRPSGLANTDIIVACLGIGSAGIAAPDGTWIQFAAAVTSSAIRAYGYYHIVTNAGGEPATYTFSGWTAARSTGETVAYSGVDNVTPIDVAASVLTNSAGATTLILPSITTVTDGAMLISGAGQDSATGTDTIPGTMGRVADSTGTGKRFGSADETFVTHGATGTRTWTFDSSALAHAGFLGALRPAATAAVPWNPQRYGQPHDYSEAQWSQRDRRNIALVATAANPLPSPLDTAWQAGGRYWHLYGDAAPRFWPGRQRLLVSDPTLLAPSTADPLTLPDARARQAAAADYVDRREVPNQPQRESDPLLLGTALLENELLGGADTAKRAVVSATHAARWWMPQQPQRKGLSPGLLDDALLEGSLLAGDTHRHVAAASCTDRREVPQQRPYVSDPALLIPPLVPFDPTLGGWTLTWQAYNQAALHVDRREVPQQRAYISDPSFYPTSAPTDPLTVAWGVEGAYWLLYNLAALQVSRRLMPQQRDRESDPTLLLQALLENELLGSADDLARHRAWFTDRRQSVGWQPRRPDPNQFAVTVTDPLSLAGGVGGDTWRRVNLPVYADRREVPVQPPRWTLYFDAGPDSPPLTLTWGAGGAWWHLYSRAADATSRAWWPQQRPVFALPPIPITTPPPRWVEGGADIGAQVEGGAATGTTLEGGASSATTTEGGADVGGWFEGGSSYGSSNEGAGSL